MSAVTFTARLRLQRLRVSFAVEPAPRRKLVCGYAAGRFIMAYYPLPLVVPALTISVLLLYVVFSYSVRKIPRKHLL
jgi:hypothetical protein